MQLLKTSISWFGKHSGYECLVPYLDKYTEVNVVEPQRDFFSRLKGKGISLCRGYGAAPQHYIAALNVFEKRVAQKGEYGHILYAEDFLPYIHKVPKAVLAKTLFTFHQPAERWSSANLQRLALVKHALFLYDQDKSFFSKYLNGSIGAIHYGVDIDFFKPRKVHNNKGVRILYCGVHLRNVAMFCRIAKQISIRWPHLEFDLLVPPHRRESFNLDHLQLSNIHWHTGLEDEGLRELYHNAKLLLLPMNDSGASTSIVEALACGLPIATTDVGGIQFYGGESIFPLIKNNDDESMMSLIQRYLEDEPFHAMISKKQRLFAEEHLNWERVALRHIEHYQYINNNSHK